jgi:hypothetical protein
VARSEDHPRRLSLTDRRVQEGELRLRSRREFRQQCVRPRGEHNIALPLISFGRVSNRIRCLDRASSLPKHFRKGHECITTKVEPVRRSAIRTPSGDPLGSAFTKSRRAPALAMRHGTCALMSAGPLSSAS